ncbi:MAG TPA: DUF5343 domain-containing protein [Candidatus Binataceae bacterium]|nr:DUF5343 domain-containing protein [Candidatus Binataceae bacterium]
MPDYPPFMNAYGNIGKILSKIKEAQTPERFTQDYLGTKLGFTGGSATPFIPFAKRLGLLGSDGAPTDLYKRFRNPSQSGFAMAEAIKTGYSALFERNEYAYELDHGKLVGLTMEVTGLARDNGTLRSIVGSFETLKTFAQFDTASVPTEIPKEKSSESRDSGADEFREPEVGLNLSYTIYLNLPKTDDIAVFNAIFKSLRENFFRR